ncbi:YolD-like family protein [Paenibacillus sp. FSL L8-0696]|uniref:YolD-like family protein n=1 Tax=Paenibacillus sp. FSL L8-0696 TaxID=2954524 RepID=UPI0031192E74
MRSKPDLDPQALAEISQVLAQSLEDCSPITITFFGEYEDRSIHGIIMRVDQQLKQIKFRQDDDWEWIKVADIIEVST